MDPAIVEEILEHGGGLAVVATVVVAAGFGLVRVIEALLRKIGAEKNGFQAQDRALLELSERHHAEEERLLERISRKIDELLEVTIRHEKRSDEYFRKRLNGGDHGSRSDVP